MPGLVPGIHVFLALGTAVKTWMAGTSPAMTGREPNGSGVAAVFAKQVELLLHRAIRETEQHRILVGLVGNPLPARHHEQVARPHSKVCSPILEWPRPSIAANTVASVER